MTTTTATLLTGKNLIAGEESAQGDSTFRARDPKLGADLEPAAFDATVREIDEAAKAAADAFEVYRKTPAADIAKFLERVAENLGAVSDALIERADQETALGKPRLTGELARTRNQILLYASVAKKGDWLDARIDRAMPDRKPLPRPDLRRVLIPIGPVAVWSASNFPLAYSVAGGDTASALASGNTVVVKTHPAHPGSSEIAARAIVSAVEASGLPSGVFSMIHGRTPEMSVAVIKHPAIKAGAFTGSLRAGRALYDAANTRPEPIPFFAEMGSINPVFILPNALEEQGEQIAEGLFNSINLGVGQFCTNPGVAAALDSSSLEKLTRLLTEKFSKAAPGTMLYSGLRDVYAKSVDHRKGLGGVQAVLTEVSVDPAKTESGPAFFQTDCKTFLANEELREELFGPSSIFVRCSSNEDLERVARSMAGNLTATVIGTPEDLAAHGELIALLEMKVGRLILNGYPTGVEVCAAMQHVGPYPATTDSRFTSVGTAALQRFARPICYQNFPDELLPAELQNANPRGILRIVEGETTRDPIA